MIGYALLLKHGWYDATSNKNGVVKDHCLSVIDGFENNMSASLVGHLANCELLQYRDNAQKGRQSSISVEKLQEEIRQWSN
jgi:hypothetical protein